MSRGYQAATRREGMQVAIYIELHALLPFRLDKPLVVLLLSIIILFVALYPRSVHTIMYVLLQHRHLTFILCEAQLLAGYCSLLVP